MSRKRTATTIVAALAFLAASAGRTARSQSTAKARSGRGPTAAEFEALKKRVDEQNELIMKLTQLEGAHYEYLIKLLQSGRPGSAPIARPNPAAALPPSSTPPAAAAVAPPADADGAGSARPHLASITGHVDVKGKARAPIYVYVDNIKEPATDRTVEIAQKDRSFVPNFLVVQKGTRVVFPNSDPFLHNVFSPSPTSPFDLGSYRQGEKPGSVRLFNAGVVEVLCNMHAKMRADILVVPNRHHVKVNGDGSFRLDNVPVGARTVVAWTPDAKPMTASVALTPAGASANFALQVEPAGVPLDKTGKPRPAYRQEE
jgi:plastocyanin